jgi:4'-phosphopantetheinyl transferase
MTALPTSAVVDLLADWNFAPEAWSLGEGEVHVWRIWLSSHLPRLDRLRPLLSADEHRQAERFYFQRDQQRFIVGRGLLRTILGQYLNVPPAELAFAYGPQGKPELGSAECVGIPRRNSGEFRADAGTQLRFNVSHSHDLALVAVASGREIGVDVERVRPGPARERIAERYFSARETTLLRSLPADQQDQAFFRCWTRKEAYLKGRGAGLSIPLDSFEVSLLPGEAATLWSADDEAMRWTLRGLEPAPHYLAALAVERDDWHLECGTWA